MMWSEIGEPTCKARSRLRNTSPSNRRWAIRRLFGSQTYGKMCATACSTPGDAAGRNGQVRDRNDDPVAQCPCRSKRSLIEETYGIARRQTMYSPASAQTTEPVCRLRRTPDARSQIAATAELTRCVKDLGMVGALVNGFSQAGTPDNIPYYDLPSYRPFWRAVEAARRAVLPAPAQSTAELDQVLRGPRLDARPDLGLCCRNRRPRSAADRLSGLFDQYPRVEDQFSGTLVKVFHSIFGELTIATAG